MAEAQVIANGAIASASTVNTTKPTSATTTHIPIAQLTPLLAASASRSIKAIVTLTWPYSSVSGSVAFLLAEPDFRLRRIRGQVRVQFAGSSAKAVSKAGIASGDEVLLFLEGVEFVHNEELTISTPGRGVEFELRFTERLVIEFRTEGSEDASKIDIDHPATEPEIIQALSPPPEPPLSPLPSVEPGLDVRKLAGGEWSSPAFIKRARTSWGSLFDSDYDPFSEEDGSVRGKGRKRTRLSSSWRYNSRSPTPEPEDQVMEESSVQEPVKAREAPTMTDEASQTIGLEEESAAEALANFSRQGNNIGGNSYAVNVEAPLEQTQELDQQVTISEDHLHPEIRENTDATHSPRLEPVNSDLLPTISSLVPFKAGLLDVVEAHIQQQQSSISQAVALGNDSTDNIETQDDLYTASPLHRHEEETAGNLVEAEAQSTIWRIGEAEESSPVKDHPEDQYGHWQSVNAQRSELDYAYASEEGSPDGRPYAGNPSEEDYEAEPEFEPTISYPEIEDAADEGEPPGWETRPFQAAYPKLPDTYDSRESSLPMAPPPGRSSAMSRSQSALSEQIDLTEDDDDEIPRPRLESPIEDDMDENREFDEEEEENYMADDYEDGEHEPALAHNRDLPDMEDVEGSDLGNSSYKEDEMEEDAGEEGEEEADSDMDEMENDDRRMKGPPEVIEIMSSDEDESTVVPNKPRIVQHARVSINPQRDDHESGESDEEEDSYVKDEISEQSDDEEPRSLAEEAEGEDSQSESAGEDAYDLENEENISSGPMLQDPYSRISNSQMTEEARRGLNIVDDDSDARQVDGSNSSQVSIDHDGVHSPLDSLPEKADLSRPGMHQTQFSMDGAADEDATVVEHLELPEGEVSHLEEQGTGEAPVISKETSKQANGQLPTPANTQLSEQVLSTEHSFNSVAGIAPSESEDGVFEDELPEVLETSKASTAIASPRFDASMTGVDDGALAEPMETESAMQEISEKTRNNLPPTAPEVQSPKVIHESADFVMGETFQEESDEVETPSAQLLAYESPFPEEGTDNMELILNEPSKQQDNFSVTAKLQNPETLEMLDQLDADVVMEESEETGSKFLIGERPEHAVPETLEEEFGVIVEQPEKAASEELQKESPDITEANSPIHETLEEEFEAIIEQAEKAAGEEIQRNHLPENEPDSIEPGTLEEEFEAIIEQTEKEATNEIQRLSSHLEVSVEPMVPETLEEEFESIVEEAVKEASGMLQDHLTPLPTSTKTAEDLQAPAELVENQGPSSSTPMKTRNSLPEIASSILGHESKINNLQSTEMNNIRDDDGEIDVETSIRKDREIFTPQKDTVSADSAPSTESPRRSTRRSMPMPSALNVKDDLRPVTPNKTSKHLDQNQVSPVVLLGARGTPQGHDASLELALAASESPTKHDLRRPSDTDVKLRLSRALRTELSQFTPLKVLRYHLNQKLDVLGIVTTTPPEPQRAKGGPRHYSVVFNITDPSIAPSGVAEVQVFRPYKDALPTIEVGDGILLRNFQVLSVKKGFALRSTQDEGSSWAVFKDAEEPEVRGPPVEYGEGEKHHVTELKAWFEDLDVTSIAKIERANGEKGAPAKKH